ncbi:unnamed protein product [marine sediment metagenome]|uniref:Uncharacterized protein n=1 Tax=marine sediment metagenome TaxID=412755 RepID=X1TYR1_9ZZZZ
MKNIGPEEPIEQTITPETRDKALEMLRSRQCNALREVEKLLGWESSMAMGDSLGLNIIIENSLGYQEL